jgi:hypothetical protein
MWILNAGFPSPRYLGAYAILHQMPVLKRYICVIGPGIGVDDSVPFYWDIIAKDTIAKVPP